LAFLISRRIHPSTDNPINVHGTLATLFVAISTSFVIYFKAHNLQFESTSFYFNFYITLFDWLKQLRSLSIDNSLWGNTNEATCIFVATASTVQTSTINHCSLKKHLQAAHPQQPQFNTSLHSTTKKQATQKPI
jgi:hypothetical protein